MSRTKKGKKSPGHEYWTPRPMNYSGGAVGKKTKVMTHRIERRTRKKLSDDHED